MPLWTRDSVSLAPKVIYTPDDHEAAQCDQITYDPTGEVPTWEIRACHIGGAETKSEVETLMEASGGLSGV